MNTITQVNIDYLRPDRTVETLLLEKDGARRMIIVYNYKGIHFRIFQNQKEVKKFIKDGIGVRFIPEFLNENDLDDHLQKTTLFS